MEAVGLSAVLRMTFSNLLATDIQLVTHRKFSLPSHLGIYAFDQMLLLIFHT